MLDTLKKHVSLQWGIVIVIVILVVIPLMVLFSIESYFYPSPYIDTEFAHGFSWENYEKVENGMTEQEVVALLGSPFEKPAGISGPKGGCGSISGKGECWVYTQDGKSPHWDFAWIAVIVRFDENMRADGKQQITFHD